jgi:hypothetical protein
MPLQPSSTSQPHLRLPAEPFLLEPISLATFLAMTDGDVENLALRSLSSSPTGTTWLGLSNLMKKSGYATVSEVGFDAATAWAHHLGVVDTDSPAA